MRHGKGGKLGREPTSDEIRSGTKTTELLFSFTLSDYFKGLLRYSANVSGEFTTSWFACVPYLGHEEGDGGPRRFP